jgi:hypothetical protein
MKKENDTIEKALAAAYRNRQGPEPGEDWEMSVMRSIRKVPEVSPGIGWSELIGRLFWEICPAACAIIIFLAIASYRLNVVPPEDLAQMVTTDDTIEVILADSNG